MCIVLCEVMEWKNVLLGVGVSIAAIAYWLYTPLPDGYSSACARHIQFALASYKVIFAVVCVLVCILFSLLCISVAVVEQNNFYGCTGVRLQPKSGLFLQIRLISGSGQNWAQISNFAGFGKLSLNNTNLNDLYMKNLFQTTYNCSINGMCHFVRVW